MEGSQRGKGGELEGVRKQFPSKKALLCFKKVLKGKKVSKKRPENLLRTHFPSKKVLGSLPSSLLTPSTLLQKVGQKNTYLKRGIGLGAKGFTGSGAIVAQ